MHKCEDRGSYASNNVLFKHTHIFLPLISKLPDVFSSILSDED